MPRGGAPKQTGSVRLGLRRSLLFPVRKFARSGADTTSSAPETLTEVRSSTYQTPLCFFSICFLSRSRLLCVGVWRVHGGGGGGYLGGVRGRDRARGGQHQLGEVRATSPFLES